MAHFPKLIYQRSKSGRLITLTQYTLIFSNIQSERSVRKTQHISMQSHAPTTSTSPPLPPASCNLSREAR